MKQVLFKFLVGGIAGIAVWMVFEPMAPTQFRSGDWDSFEQMYILSLGCTIGLAIGGLNGFLQGGKVHFLRGLFLGLIFAAIGATFGHSLGSVMFKAVAPTGPGLLIDPRLIVARILGLTPIGLFLGLAIGASTLNVKRAVQGAIGGGLAAFLGGSVFDIIGMMSGPLVRDIRGGDEVGIVPRAVLAITMGALIGLFIGLVELASRSAWLRLSLGRNEGREWSLDQPQTFIGRSESAHVPLFGDANIAPIHASIQRQGNNYVLVDGGSPLGTGLNGQRVSQAVLMPGSIIEIGHFKLEFLMKNMPAPFKGPEQLVNQAYPLGNFAAPAFPGGPVPASSSAMISVPMAPPNLAPTMAYSPASSQGFALVALDGPLTGTKFPVSGSLDLGRESTFVPMSYDSGASRRHATVAPGLGGLSVTDQGSTNGTFVNGQRVQSAQAIPGDLIKVGSTTFRVEPT